MVEIQETQAKRIGVDVWWDHKTQRYRHKKINLNKIPLIYRCPNCGKILVNSEHRRWNYLYETTEFELNWWGGVCYNCYLDGFGKHGAFGAFLKKQLEKDERKIKTFESERLNKYGKEPKYWLNPGFTENPAWREWNQRRAQIDEDEKRRKNAKPVTLLS
jgi:hypothetical protein